ncbi:cysteine-rich CWC family protein [Tepidimonas fonticaldi]|uniref:cysteine-rich CWC family protein n=1 Tax=Tepidimonas fonticaldi TaxID=1101373 RepID=UPI0009EE48C1
MPATTPWTRRRLPWSRRWSAFCARPWRYEAGGARVAEGVTVAAGRVDPTRCPICGGGNGCAMERERQTGRAQPPCWCTQAHFGAEVLDRVPAGARGLACICARCAGATPLSTG